ncbi:myosin-3 [Copidosoma floridanum]|uniref:myosin-3 n=1 Tax=Copidosoma floridanum TaxID=29053 RepID=UPI0006C9C68D|nr:myosin-3 [Copidosoma floridanum]
MTSDNCLVCASDEGVFLDVEEQPVLKIKAKNCRLDKVTDGPTSKICHKCAFELDQCNTFVEKIKEASKKPSNVKLSCYLCSDLLSNLIYFDLTNHENGADNLLKQIQDLLSEELKDKSFQKQLICLSCRYCVDLLQDLRNLSNEITGKLKSIIQNGIHPADLPKTKTFIVNRNTTLVQTANFDLNTPSDTDSEISDTMGSKKKNKSNKSTVSKSQQNCKQCKISLKDKSSYRFHRTEIIVCKECWLTTDPIKTQTKNRKQVNYPSTTQCSVLLKDLYLLQEKEFIIKDEENEAKFIVISSSVDKKTFRSPASKKIDEEKKNTTFEESDEEIFEVKKSRSRSKVTKGKPKKKGSSNKSNSKAKSRQKGESDSEHVEEQGGEEEEEESPKPARNTRMKKNIDQNIQEVMESRSTKKSRRRKDSELSMESEDTQPSRSIKNKKSLEGRSIRATRKRKESEQSVQEEEIKLVKSSRSRKNSELSDISTAESKSTRTRRRIDSELSVHEESEIEVDNDSDSGPVLKKAKQSGSKSVKKTVLKSKNNQNSRKRGRSSSVESTGSIRKSARNARKNIVNDLDEIIEVDDDDVLPPRTEKEDLSESEDFSKTKKQRVQEMHSDGDHSEIEDQFKKSTPSSSKESTPTSKSSPKQKRNRKELLTKTRVTEILTVSEKPSDNSESEEIDVLKSTDEETKDDENDRKIKRASFEKKTVDIDNDLEGDAASDEDIQALVGQKIDSESIVEKLNEGEIIKSAENDVPKTMDENVSIGDKSDKKDSALSDREEDEEKETDFSRNETKEDENEGNESDTSKKSSRASSSRRSSLNLTRQSKQNKKSGGKKKSPKSAKSKNNIIIDGSDNESTVSTPKANQDIQPVDKSYTCTVCSMVYESRLTGIEHELTHMKVLQLKLERVVVPKKVDEELRISSEREIPEENGKENGEMEVDEELEEKNEGNQDKGEKMLVGEEEKELIDEDVEMVEKDDVIENDTEKITGKEDEEVIENDVSKKSKMTNDVSSDDESERETKSQRSTRQSKQMVGKDDEKPKGRRSKAVEDDSESEKEAESHSDKIAEAVQETLNDIAELHEKPQDKSKETEEEEPAESDKAQGELANEERENESETEEEKTEIRNEKTLNNDEERDENEQNQETVAESPVEMDNENNDEEEDEVVETENVRREVPNESDEIIECDTIDEDKDEDVECIEATPVVDVDESSKDIDESSKDVVDAEKEAEKRQVDNEIEITEIDDGDQDEDEPIETMQCENIDLTENDGCEELKDDHGDDDEIEEVVDSSKITQDDENTVDSITEINVNASEEPDRENNDGNTKKSGTDNNEDEENMTEDEEALEEHTLEELLQRKGLQVVDELGSVTDGDEESEKETNTSMEKENCSGKDGQHEIKISESECTDVSEIRNNKSSSKQKDNGDGTLDECQIIQDVDVVEEVVNTNEQQQTEEVQEDEVENNVSLNIALY